jgi:excisionase family DNA binding protein
VSRTRLNATKPALTPEEFYRGIGRTIGRRKIYELLRSGRLKSVRVGSNYRLPRSELTDFWTREAEVA